MPADAAPKAMIAQAIVSSLTQSGSEPDLVVKQIAWWNTSLEDFKDPRRVALRQSWSSVPEQTRCRMRPRPPLFGFYQHHGKALAKMIGNAPFGGVIFGDASSDRSTISAYAVPALQQRPSIRLERHRGQFLQSSAAKVPREISFARCR